jgi:hypothetical protein
MAYEGSQKVSTWHKRSMPSIHKEVVVEQDVAPVWTLGMGHGWAILQ